MAVRCGLALAGLARLGVAWCGLLEDFPVNSIIYGSCMLIGLDLAAPLPRQADSLQDGPLIPDLARVL
jgi:hypothetical protein